MPFKRVTMADIAQACGLSRNTVSKIFNNRGTVPEGTRQMVLKKAQELGYHLLPEKEAPPVVSRNLNIALLTRHMPSDYHFGTFFIPAFADQLSRVGYTLTMCEITPEELASGSLPHHLVLEQTAGILAIELFDRPYHEMLCGLGIPVLSVDAYFGAHTAPMKCDMISMENISSAYALTAQLLDTGARHLGFVGDVEHCNSFHERWLGFSAALQDRGMPVNRATCILEPDSAPYHDPEWVIARLRKMPVLPDAFLCANDFLALHLMTTLKRNGISIPGDVMVAGFDGTPQSAIVEPSLTTAQIPSAEIGRLAAETLLNRIENPERPFQRTYVHTTPQFRSSTAREAIR
ncbi:MAG TPA: LacI family DNA-binding transcriptional regulator [Candidatus Avoscillospira avicola]|uniref:LacI family DNA-binding transcriptional regulator n=1 Tax=Candidatus Avoscillospira avicola TaxID=2840706 RepID=A0A9D1IX51_9FIRM|nr:LacI family DNA-binding transcriptional regulator [Candidatus Avoscillospira avicola]